MTLHNLLFSPHKQCMNDITKAFLSVSSSVWSKQLFCAVSRPKKRTKLKHTKISTLKKTTTLLSFRRHFAPSCLLLEHIIIPWLKIFAIFYRRTFHLNTVLLTFSLLYRTSNLYPSLVNLWSPLM